MATTPASPAAKQIRAARTRNMTAAKRSLGLIITELAQQQAALEQGTVPDGLPTASLAKYDQAVSALRLLDSLAGEPEPEPEAPANGQAAISPADVAVLLETMSGLGLLPAEVGAGTPLARLADFAYGHAAPVPVPPVPPPLSGDDPYDPARETPAQYGTRRAEAISAAVSGQPVPSPAPAAPPAAG